MPLADPVLTFTLTAGVAWLFLASAVHKIKDAARFREALRGYELIPPSWAPVAARLILLLEGVVVVGSLVPATRTLAMLLAAGLLSLYAIAIAINLARGRTRIDCGCAGFGSAQRISEWMVRRNAIVACAALIAAWPMAQRLVSGSDLFVIACATCAAAALYVAQGILADVRQRLAG